MNILTPPPKERMKERRKEGKNPKELYRNGYNWLTYTLHHSGIEPINCGAEDGQIES
jgi:hypothetical protein